METNLTLPQTKSLLSRVLFADALYCAICGVAALLFVPLLTTWLGIPGWAVALVGVGLVGYAGILLSFVTRNRVSRALGWSATTGNILWIDATVLLVWFGWLPLQPAGRWLLIDVAIIVGIFAVLQIVATIRHPKG